MRQAHTFQTLPAVVVNQIITHLHDNHLRPSRVCVKNLLSVSTVWRKAALHNIYIACGLYLNELPAKLKYYNKGNTTIFGPKTRHYTHYAKKVDMFINYNNALSGAASAWFDSNAHNVNFANANVLHIIFCGYSVDDDIYTLNYSSNMDSLLRHINHLIPTASRVEVKLMYVNAQIDVIWSQFSRASMLLLNGKYEGSLSVSPEILPIVPIKNINITGLTRLTCSWNTSYKSAAQLIQSSSQSLISLTLFCYQYDLHNLVIMDDTTPITYPYLEQLDLLEKTKDGCVKVRPIESIRPFPKLKSLQLEIDYPFSDDVLFRGNSRTLESLTIKITDPSISMLTHSGVFDKANMTNIKILKLVEAFESANVLEADECMLINIIKNAGNLGFIIIKDSGLSRAFLNNIKHVHLERVQGMLLVDQYLSLVEITNAIHHMPSVREFRCRISALGNELQHMDSNELSSFLSTYCCPLSNSLVGWTITNSHFLSIRHAMTYILFVANACNNLREIRFTQSKHDMQIIHQALMNSSLYQKFNLSITFVDRGPGLYFWQVSRSKKT